MAENTHEHIRLPPKWIALNINKRECNMFIPIPGDNSICQCGRRKMDHGDFVNFSKYFTKWSPYAHSRTFPTDAYGTILFEGEHHPNKSHYARLSFDTNPTQVLTMMRYVWGIPLPKLIISLHGGSLNFEMPPRLGSVFQNGIVKVAQTTSAWLFSNGLNSGVSKQLGNALGNCMFGSSGGYKHGHFVSVGVAPWGMCEHRSDLLGRNRGRVYSPVEVHNSNMLHLNSRHSNFLLVDNGSIGRFGGETFFRRKLEKCVASCPISQSGSCTIPLVVIIMEGGGHTLRLISEYLYDEPNPVPIILMAGTGRITDFLAWMLRTFQYPGELQLSMDSVVDRIGKIFNLHRQAAFEVFQECEQIFQKRSLITVYNGLSASERDFDTAILSSVFSSQQWTSLEHLELSLVWNRVDLARNEVFVYGREWNRAHLEQAMMEALISNRLDFVELLMEHGINMKSFLTVHRLEQLYSTVDYNSYIGSLLLEISNRRRSRSRSTHSDINGNEGHFTLLDIGQVLAKIGLHRPEYFQAKPSAELGSGNPNIKLDQPFDELFLWAVLTKRHTVARHLWTHGQGALAKSLVAVTLNRFFAKQVYKINISFVKEYVDYAAEWKKWSLTLLDSCYREDFSMTRQLLTMELKNWSKQTCLSLAILSDHKKLLGHPCCQILLSDLWMGAFNIKRYSSVKVFMAAVCPLFAFCLDYKSKEVLTVFPRSNQSPGKAQNRVLTTATSRMDKSMTTVKNGLEKSATPVSKNLRSRHKFGRKTDLSRVVSKLNFGKEISSTPNKDDQRDPGNNRTQLDGEKGPDMKDNTKCLIVAFVDRKEGKDCVASSESGFDYKVEDNLHDNELNEVASGFVTTEKNLTACQKLYESQRAPATKFVRRFAGYLAFIFCLWYVILFNQEPNQIGMVEGFVTLFVLTLGMECTIQVIMRCTMAEMNSYVWRWSDLVVTTFFLGGTLLRFLGYFKYAIVIYQTSSVYWNVRIYKFLGTSRFIGPKLLMMKRMFKHMIYFSLIIMVMIFAFAVARQSIRSPHSDPTWNDMKPSFLEPYVMMFGQTAPLEETINAHCIDDLTGKSECPMGSWLIPIFWVVYMMISNILVVNVLIAVFNGIYAEIDSNSVEIWMSHQFLEVVEFMKMPSLPPPFSLICFVGSAIKSFCAKCKRCLCSKKNVEKTEDCDTICVLLRNDNSLKTRLNPAEQAIVRNDILKIFDFEEGNVNLLRHVLSSANGATLFGFTEVPYRVGLMSEKPPSTQLVKNSLQELYAEMEVQRHTIDKLKECLEMRVAPPEGNHVSHEENDELSSSDSSEIPS